MKNTLLHQDLKCINGCDSYDPKTLSIIFCSEWDDNLTRTKIERFGNLAKDNIFACWRCPKCAWVNSVDWRRCIISNCGHKRVEASCQTEYIGTRPYDPASTNLDSSINSNNNNRNTGNDGVRENNWGSVSAGRDEYFASFGRLKILNGRDRLHALLGEPYRNLYSKTAMFKQLNTGEIKHGHSYVNMYGLDSSPIGLKHFNFDSRSQGNQGSQGNQHQNKTVEAPFNFHEMKLVSHRNIALNQNNFNYFYICIINCN